MNNVITLKGNLGLITYLPLDKDYTLVAIRLCVKESLGIDTNGNKKTKDTWFNLIAHGTAFEEFRQENFQVGDFVKIEGSVNPESTIIDGVKYSPSVIKLNKTILLSKAIRENINLKAA